MKRPLRMEICKLLEDGESKSTHDIIDILRPQYIGERQINTIEEHLQSLRVVGIIFVCSETVEIIEQKECLVQNWMLTNHGKQKLAKLW